MLKTNSLSSIMGVEVLEFDIKNQNTPEIVNEIKSLLNRHQVVVIRDVNLNPEEQIAFCGQFGEIEMHPLEENTIQHREMTIISNVVENGASLGYQGPLFELWHSDMCYYEQVSSMTFLYAYCVPEKNGETLFANMQLAYAELDPEIKNKITGKYAVFGSSENLMKRCQARGYNLQIDPKDRNPDVLHPVVITHPKTDIPSIYVNWTHTDRILEIEDSEQEVLLNRIFDHCHQDKYRFIHNYLPRDLIVWDNYSVIHTGSPNPPVGNRIMRRIAIKGVQPKFKKQLLPEKFKTLAHNFMLLALIYLSSIFITPISFAIDTKYEKISAQLKTLTDINAPSGFEKPMREHLKKKWLAEKFFVKIDGLGNMIVSSQTIKKDKPTVLLVAHMDEVGLLVKDLDDRGFFTFELLGGWASEALTSQKWIITNEKGESIIGFTGVESGHIIETFPETPKINYRSLFIDVGASSKKELQEKFHIRPGLAIVPSTKFEVINTKYVAAKALDDRIGISLLIDILREFKNKKLDYNLVIAATVQEEVGMRGAEALFGSVKPDLVFNIDIALAKDFPQVLRRSRNEPVLGKGPVFFAYEPSSIPDQTLFSYVKEVAIKSNIIIQYAVEINTGLDACSIQRKGDGVPIFNLGIPTRYVHAPYGLTDLNDYFLSFDLLKRVLNKLDSSEIKALKPNFDSSNS